VAAIAANLVEQAEIIVTDNASSPPVTLSELTTLSLPIRIVTEPELGSAHARLTALRTARGTLIVFVDDDNILGEHYLKNALTFMDAHPEVGALGGKIEPEFSAKPNASILPHLGLLALRNFGENEAISNWNPDRRREYPWNAPYGAGMVLRSSCATAYVNKVAQAKCFSVGRKGTRTLGGCEDVEIILYGVLETGYQVAYSPRLHLTHIIPNHRITTDYLQKLAYESGISWGEFCVRHHFEPPIAKWTLPLRFIRCFFRLRAWTTSGRLAWKTEKGRFIGRSRAAADQKS
jgi:GT2 family glycosyltransferase